MKISDLKLLLNEINLEENLHLSVIMKPEDNLLGFIENLKKLGYASFVQQTAMGLEVTVTEKLPQNFIDSN